MTKAKQITVWLDSAPGQAGNVAGALAAAGVDITAFECHTQSGASPLRLQADPHARALNALRSLGLRVTEEVVLRLTVADRPGGLAEIGARLGQAGINIEYGYGTAAGRGRKADLVVAVSDPDGALRALKGFK